MLKKKELKPGDFAQVIADYDTMPDTHHPSIGPHRIIGRHGTIRCQSIHAGHLVFDTIDGASRTIHPSHLAPADKSELPDRSQFPPGTWVYLAGNTLNPYYVMDRQTALSQYILRVRPLNTSIEGEAGSEVGTYGMTVAKRAIAPAPEIPLGYDVITTTGRRGTALQKIPCAAGGDLYRVLLANRGGYGYLYAHEMKVDPKALEPDEHGHVHKWTVKWEGTYRECLCGVKQWQLACWSQGQWSDKLPSNQKASHQTLDFDASSTKRMRDIMADKDRWTEEPHRTRSYDIIPRDILDTPINIIGCGAIGSFTALGLMKTGFKNLHLWDFDKVAIENVGTQLYGATHVRTDKVSALNQLLGQLGPPGDLPAMIHNERWNCDTLDDDECSYAHDHDDEYDEDDCVMTSTPEHMRDGGIVIMAVDSMKARREIWDSLKDYTENCISDDDVDWVIDGRMGAEHALMYTMAPTDDDADIATYEKTLYSDDNALQEPCTAAGTAYTALLISGWICKSVKDVLTRNPKYIRIGMWNIADNQQMVYHKEGAFAPVPEPVPGVQMLTFDDRAWQHVQVPEHVQQAQAQAQAQAQVGDWVLPEQTE